MSDIIIRAATIADALDILKIYGYYVEKTAVSFEYTVPSVLEFSKRIENTLSNIHISWQFTKDK